MNKKIKATIVSLIAVAVLCSAFGCNTHKPKDRENLMTITSVTQYADGSVHATLDFGEISLGPSDYYDLQFSIDGGNTWAKSVSKQITASTLSEKDANVVPVLTYYNYLGKYILGGSIGEEYTVDARGGDTIEVTMRILGNYDYKDSNACTPVSFTLKPLSPAGAELPKFDSYSRNFDLMSGGGKEEEYGFEEQPDNTFKLRKIIYDPNRNDDTIITADLTAEDDELFEYKFYDPTPAEKEKLYYTSELAQDENKAIKSGWQDCKNDTVITRADCNSHVVYEYADVTDYDENGNVTARYLVRRKVAIVLLRYKETSAASRSLHKPVYLILSDFENVPD